MCKLQKQVRRKPTRSEYVWERTTHSLLRTTDQLAADDIAEEAAADDLGEGGVFGDVAVPPPPPDPFVPAPAGHAPPGPAAEGREKAEVAFAPPCGGRIAFYRRGNTETFVADCPVHANCKLKRTAHPPAAKLASMRKGQGRPCGLMMAWLAAADTIDRYGHTNPFFVAGISRARRLAGREVLKTSEPGRDLLSREAPRGDPGDESEPEAVP